MLATSGSRDEPSPGPRQQVIHMDIDLPVLIERQPDSQTRQAES
jgi:hypothetical protein